MTHWLSQHGSEIMPQVIAGLAIVFVLGGIVWYRRRNRGVAGLQSLQDLAKRQGGSVVMNEEGKPQWRVPFYGATLVVGFRTTKGVTQKSAPLPWTRVALEVPGLKTTEFRGILMQERHAPNPNVWRVLAPLRETAAWGPLKLVIDPNGEVPTVEIWRFGWGRQDVNWIEQTLVYSLDVLLDLTRTVCENPYNAKSLRESLTTSRIFKKPFLTLDEDNQLPERVKSAIFESPKGTSESRARLSRSTQTESHNYQRLPSNLSQPANHPAASGSTPPQIFLS